MTLENLLLLKVGLQSTCYVLLSLLLLISFVNFTAAETEFFIESLAEKAAEAETQKTTVVSGKEGWLFFAPELRSMSVGQFWGDAPRRFSRA
ncbi:hypothetical protein F4Y19_08960 [Candidatus Poribacteria bacterium]|nr:hypothetical protein [Candidatus Poribacteria bacterium]